MKIRAVLKRLVAVAHTGGVTAALERIVSGLDKQRSGKVHGRWPKVSSRLRWQLALLCLAKMKPVSDGQRRRWLATVKGSDDVEG